MAFPEVVVAQAGLKRLRRSGHPWIYHDALVSPGRARHGDVVRVQDDTGAFVGYAFYSEKSKIRLRVFLEDDRVPDADLWRERLQGALAFRANRVGEDEAYRVVYGDSDGFPGWILDRYGEHWVVQALTAGAERWVPLWIELLRSLAPVRSVLARNDATARRLEGLDVHVADMVGHTPDRVRVRLGGLEQVADLMRGQKTGLFLDQRENHRRAADWLSGRVLDAFCYTGGFALAAASRGARVVLVDSSRGALELAHENFRRNALAYEASHRASVFRWLRDAAARGERFDGIVLDPPAFAKSRRDLPAAQRAYREIHVRALRCLSPSGILVTCSCSYNLSEPAFRSLVAEAARDVRRSARIAASWPQAVDHPPRLGMEETRYLKCLIIQAD